MYQNWRIYLDLWGHDCKKWVWPTFGCKLGQSDPIVMQLKLDMLCHLLNVYTKFQIDISKHVEEKSGKPGRTDGRTDGQTDGHCHGIIRPFFKRAYKNGTPGSNGITAQILKTIRQSINGPVCYLCNRSLTDGYARMNWNLRMCCHF